MERLRVDPQRPDPEVVKISVEALLKGAIVAYPTETFYGLGANAFDAVACRRIVELKGRRADKALPLIISDVGQLGLVAAEIPPAVICLAKRFWPGALTLVIPLRSDPPQALAGSKTVAVRVSGLFLPRELARAAGVPLTATSANRSGKPPIRSADEVEAVLGDQLDLLLDGGDTVGGKPSTIVDLSVPRPRLLRNGVISFEEVWKALNEALS